MSSIRAALASLVAASAYTVVHSGAPEPFRYVAIFDYPEAHFPYAVGPGRVTVLIGSSDVSADDAKGRACADVSRHLATVKANRGAPGWDSVMGAPYKSALEIAESTAAACTSPDNGIVCKAPHFLATAVAQADGEVSFRAAGVACNAQSAAAAERAALARCDQARQRKGVATPCKSSQIR